jgi:hypothetical protein
MHNEKCIVSHLQKTYIFSLLILKEAKAILNHCQHSVSEAIDSGAQEIGLERRIKLQ